MDTNIRLIEHIKYNQSTVYAVERNAKLLGFVKNKAGFLAKGAQWLVTDATGETLEPIHLNTFNNWKEAFVRVIELDAPKTPSALLERARTDLANKEVKLAQCKDRLTTAQFNYDNILELVANAKIEVQYEMDYLLTQ